MKKILLFLVLIFFIYTPTAFSPTIIGKTSISDTAPIFYPSKIIIDNQNSNDKINNISVAIIDSGVYPHKKVSKNIIFFKDFVNGLNKPYDDSGHGTAITGIIRSNSEKMNVNVVSLKVLDYNNYGNQESIAEALNWV